MPRKTKQKQTRIKSTPATTLRIVGGRLRGSKLAYAGDPRVRPMKDRVREAMFNLLGPGLEGMLAMDLFGGTGALALEAISRGARAAKIVERHMPTAKVIRANIAALSLDQSVELITADAFHWVRNNLDQVDGNTPWVVFLSPPYRLLSERKSDMIQLVAEVLERAPQDSLVALEATQDFDFQLLPVADQWDVRAYPPAVLGVLVVTDVWRRNAEATPIDAL